MEQMNDQGLEDITNMVKEGWPERMGFKEFYQRFEELKLEDDWPSARKISDKDAKRYVEQIAASLLNLDFVCHGYILHLHQGRLHGVRRAQPQSVL